MVGVDFGRLTVVRSAESRTYPCGQKRRQWQCRCVCGNITTVAHDQLLTGGTKSCGCLSVEMSIKRFTTHGSARHGKRSRAYQSWAAMKKRCFNPEDAAYPDYGGRGITVCERWIHSFADFLTDMGERPEGRSIERKNNSLGYCKENCVWATPIEQGNNKRNSRVFEHDGKRQTLSQWSRESGIMESRIHRRVGSGWTFADAISTPIRKGNYRRAASVT